MNTHKCSRRTLFGTFIALFTIALTFVGEAAPADSVEKANTSVQTAHRHAQSSVPPVPRSNYFTEQFVAGNDLVYTSVWYVPDGSHDFYAGCIRPSGYPPTDTAGATQLDLPNDGSALVTLGDQKTVSLYGVDYSAFYVGSNGYVTFTAPDTDPTETLEDHFAAPRISGFFTDLDPSAGGRVSWMQLVDRAVVTWKFVPTVGQSDANTIQIEMYFDGRIRVSYSVLMAQHGIAGLSEGLGLPPQFAETDLTAFSSNCLYVCLVELEGVITPVERDVDFVVTECGAPVQTFTVTASFDETGFASVTLMNVNPLGNWICADEGHTMQRLLPLGPPLPSGVDFTGPNRLLAGDLTGDNFVDIEDLSMLASHWNTPGAIADVNGDGVQDTADFTSLLINFFQGGDPLDNCAP